MICPASVFTTSRTIRLVERISPTSSAEMPSTSPNAGKVGKATPPPTPPKNTPATSAPATYRTE